DRLLEVDLPPVDLQAARVADGVRDVLGGYRAEQTTVLAGLLRDGEHRAGQDGGALLGALGGLVHRALDPGRPLLRGGDGALGRRLGELARDEEVAQVAL